MQLKAYNVSIVLMTTYVLIFNIVNIFFAQLYKLTCFLFLDWQVCGYDWIEDVLCCGHTVCAEEADASAVSLHTSRLVTEIPV